jgi:TRAP-type mannitol/chloroaromatic compound transport system permease large subunit
MNPIDFMAPAMFAALVVFLLLGLPVAFSLAALGLSSGLVAIELGLFPTQFMANLPYRVFGIMSNELLLSIPFFTLMGAILERSGLAEDLLEGFAQLFGGLSGGLAYAVIVVGAILGAITGTVAASVIAMGVIALPIMQRYGYSPRLATGVIAASGTITQVIPPSLVLIVLADQLGKSVGDMYLGAVGPSLAQILIFMAFIFVLSLLKPKSMPPLPPEARTLRGWALASKVAMARCWFKRVCRRAPAWLFSQAPTPRATKKRDTKTSMSMKPLPDTSFKRIGSAPPDAGWRDPAWRCRPGASPSRGH